MHDDIYSRFMSFLEPYAKHEPNLAELPITIDDFKGRINRMLNIRRLEEKNTSRSTRQASHASTKIYALPLIDYLGESFQQETALTPDELDSR